MNGGREGGSMGVGGGGGVGEGGKEGRERGVLYTQCRLLKNNNERGNDLSFTLSTK